MTSNWREVHLEDVADELTVGFVGSMATEYVDNEVPFLRSLNIEPYGINRKDLKYVSTEFHKKIRKSRLSPGDVVIVRTGRPGACTVIPDWMIEANCSDLVIIRPGQELDAHFLAAYINIVATRYIDSHLVGAVQQHFNIGSAKKLKMHLPPLKEQKRISKILRDLNEKIENNNALINTLEEIAQTLFKHWFVDFEFPNENGEPYKSSGGEMMESEIGNLPKEWKAGTLNDLGRIVGGGTPSKKIKEYYTEKDISWITPKDLSNDKSIYIYKGATDITEEALKKSSTNLLPENTVLFSSRAPIGYVAIAGKNVATNQGFKSIVPAQNIPTVYIFFLLKHLIPTIEANAGGSTFKEISGSGMKGIKTILPPSTLLLKYKEIVESLFNKIKFVEKENKVLIDLRDTLLPKLLSGEIELSDEIEKVLNNIGP